MAFAIAYDPRTHRLAADPGADEDNVCRRAAAAFHLCWHTDGLSRYIV
jgi:hypothetical protein